MKLLIGLLLLGTQAFAAEIPYQKATYAVGKSTISPGTLPQDICTLTGNASKTVYVTNVTISSQQTTAGSNQWTLLKRSTADTSGTRTYVVSVPMDSNSAASGSSLTVYTVNPTAGNLTGVIRTIHMLAPAPGSVAPSDTAIWDFRQGGGDQPIVLRGAAETLAVNFNGTTLPSGMVVDCNFVYSEQ